MCFTFVDLPDVENCFIKLLRFIFGKLTVRFRLMWQEVDFDCVREVSLSSFVPG